MLKAYTKCLDCKAERRLKEEVVNTNPPVRHQCPACGGNNTRVKFK